MIQENFIHPVELKKRYPFLAKKWLGQNFLIHRPILETLASRILEHRPHTVLEIGPGPGSLSQLLAPYLSRLILIEKDARFREVLEEVVKPLGKVEIKIEDFLKLDFSDLLTAKDTPTFAVGNLPYNISVPILKKLLKARNQFARFYLMFQKEVAERLTAAPSSKAYGSLSLYCQMLAEIKIILPIPPSAFYPRPRVESAVVEIIPLSKPRYPVNLEFFEQVIQAAFHARRKTLLNNLQKIGEYAFTKIQLDKILKSLGIDPKRRGETLSLQEFAELSAALV